MKILQIITLSELGGAQAVVINLANARIPFACPEEVFITETLDKYIGIIRDYIIEGLTDCYVEYDENGKEIFIPKSK